MDIDTLTEHVEREKEKVKVDHTPKPFTPIDFIKSSMVKVDGCRVVVVPTSGDGYRVNWYNPETNTITSSVFVRVVGTGKNAKLLYPSKQ